MQLKEKEIKELMKTKDLVEVIKKLEIDLNNKYQIIKNSYIN